MATIRRRLTLWYTVALGLTVLAFGAALYLERRQSMLRELDQRLTLEADLATSYLTQSHRVLGQVVTPGEQPSLDLSVSAYFEAIRDYLMVVDTAGRPLFTSEAARSLSSSALEKVFALAQPLPHTRRTGNIAPDETTGPIRYLIAPLRAPASGVGAIVVASKSGNVSFGPQQLLRSMLVVSPLILLVSIGAGYWLARNTQRPTMQMIDELEDITDGRSLHRRLAVPMGADELSRLAITLNGMLARLEQSFASLRRFTADASHELKTPLMVLRAGVERALTHPATPTESLEALDETLEQLNRMTEMVDSLLMLARADEGSETLAVEPCDLRAIVADVSETAEMLGEAQGVTVSTALPEAPVMLGVDRSRVRQLLLNLVTNAIKYTPAGGSVGLELQDQGTSVSVAVHDTGIGIAAGDLPHIFERFWRADPARSRTGDRPGVGLGLAITKWIAEAHGGAITVQSRPGRGTVFTVNLPRGADGRVTGGPDRRIGRPDRRIGGTLGLGREGRRGDVERAPGQVERRTSGPADRRTRGPADGQTGGPSG